MSKYIRIVEGILDSAASEYLDNNLLCAESVVAYAENGLDVSISESDAEGLRRLMIVYLFDVQNTIQVEQCYDDFITKVKELEEKCLK